MPKKYSSKQFDFEKPESFIKIFLSAWLIPDKTGEPEIINFTI